MSKKYYVFFIPEPLPQQGAHLVQMVQCANAAANLGYFTLLVYVKEGMAAQNPLDWVIPFRPKYPSQDLKDYYSLDDNSLQVLPLALPWPLVRNRPKNKWVSASTWLCKYYFSLHLMRHTQLVHTRDWNFIQAAIQQGIPARR